MAIRRGWGGEVSRRRRGGGGSYTAACTHGSTTSPDAGFQNLESALKQHSELSRDHWRETRDDVSIKADGFEYSSNFGTRMARSCKKIVWSRETWFKLRICYHVIYLFLKKIAASILFTLHDIQNRFLNAKTDLSSSILHDMQHHLLKAQTHSWPKKAVSNYRE